MVISGMFQTENTWTHVLLGQLSLSGVCTGCCSSPGALVPTGVLLPPPLPLAKLMYYLFYWLCFLNILSVHPFLSVKPLIQETVTVAQAKSDHQLFYKVSCENSHTPSFAYSCRLLSCCNGRVKCALLFTICFFTEHVCQPLP